MRWLYELHFRLERIGRKAKGSLSHFVAKFRQGLRYVLWGCFTRLENLGRQGRWLTFGTLAVLAGILVAGGWFLFGWGRHSLAEWRANEAIALLDENKTEEALLKARTAYIAYPDDLDFLRVATRASREAKAADYHTRAEELARHDSSSAKDVLQLVDDLLDARNLENAERFLNVAHGKGMERTEMEKRLLRMDLLAGSAGRIPALFRASALVREGTEDPEATRAYAALCTLWRKPELREEALKKLQGWAERDDETGLAALRALAFFPELNEAKKEGYLKALSARIKTGYVDKSGQARLSFLQASRDAKWIEKNDWKESLAVVPFSETEKLALSGGILWRLGSRKEGKALLNQSLIAPDPNELPIVEREILSTGNPNLAIKLFLKYREKPWLRNSCDALLINLYRKANENEMAERTADNLRLISLRSQPDLLTEAARAKILSNQKHLPEAATEMERLVAKYPHDPDFRELLGFVYHLLGGHRLALELVAHPPEEFPLPRRARAKALRVACLRELKSKDLPKEELPSPEELENLEPIERELLKI
ncbi:MAG: hypothetical protein CMI26_05450 [Opitutae bacterium]|nr:hypothetical protein [Opitutae bacterium]